MKQSRSHPPVRPTQAEPPRADPNPAAVPAPSAEELVGRVRDGDEGAFGELFDQHRSATLRVCRRMLGSNGCDDALQEIFLRARRGLPGYQADRPFRPWLNTIAANYCLDLLRRQKREALIFDPGELDSAQLPSSGPSPLGQLVEREQRSDVLDAIDALPRKYRVPLVLRFFHDLDYDGIGEVLEISRGQVGTLLFRAKQRLREQVAESRSLDSETCE